MSTVRRLVRAVALSAAAAVPVAVLAFGVRVGWHGLVEVDRSAIGAATDLTRAQPALRQALLVGQEVLQARWLNLGVLAVAAWAWWRHGLRRRALWAVATLLVAWGMANLVKLLVERARPVVTDAVADAPGYSFPSGHTANATAAAGVTVVLLWPLLGRWGRRVAVVLAAALVVVTGADRVLLGVHYPSDVIGGVLLGAAVVAGSAVELLRDAPADRPERPARPERPDRPVDEPDHTVMEERPR
ncbi:phosphatase PAP2 family protein [Actinotalea sp. M2MS4P-6]|uniref:phosphatase PAP2 family protein n=1 Tax=Actinotalea sp. M2MS4P-6 TaxID=2983762 RepID=UPI0021E445FA|nr:phosphatase PAP2 family protein [Actinotalea sp. M2MS4P-6]MCV2396055.1 phosphatase PAP2 family protein [Actinotalea sp. M2MS4P-6]